MVDFLMQSKKKTLSGLHESKPWEKSTGWNNPFADEPEDESVDVYDRRRDDRKERRRKKKKRSSRRHRMSEEEYSEMSSKAETLLDDLLGEDDDPYQMPQVQEGTNQGRDSFGAGLNPFDDSENEQEIQSTGEEIDRKEYAALLGGVSFGGGTLTKRNNYTPAVEEIEEESEEEQEEVPEQEIREIEDSSVEMLPEAQRGTNPFEDDSIADSAAFHFKEQPKPEVEKNNVVHEEDLKRQPTDSTGHESFSSGEEGEEEEEEGPAGEEQGSDVEEEEDVVESSKRLLRMADQRIQYQQYNDEVKKLRDTIDKMKQQAESMSEQLRRAVETKCDLVVAQTEMERAHEHNLILKDQELHNMKMYIQQLLDGQASSEVDYLNEISALSKQMDDLNEKHSREVNEKDVKIAQLEEELEWMRQAQVQEEPQALEEETFVSPPSSANSFASFRSLLMTATCGTPQLPIKYI